MIDVQAMLGKINVPEKDRTAYEKTCLAGMKVMFSKESHQLMIDAMNSDKPLDRKLSEGITELMVIMWKKSNGTMAPQVVVPAATYLMLQAADWLQKKGQDVTEQVIAAAMQQLVKAIMAVFGGVGPQRFMAAVNRGQQ